MIGNHGIRRVLATREAQEANLEMARDRRTKNRCSPPPEEPDHDCFGCGKALVEADGLFGRCCGGTS